MLIFGFGSYGGPAVADHLEVPDPSLREGSVLIETVVTTVNPADIKVRAGERQGAFPVDFPMAMGREAAGRVLVSTDPAFRPGDVVFGGTVAGTGSFATQVLLDAAQTAAVPPTVPAAEAASVPVAAGTAWDILHELRADGLPDGGRVLVLGAGGGVGHCAVQLARHLGHPVTGVAGVAKQEFIGRLGADWAADVRDAASVGPVAAVIDLVGGRVLQDAMALAERAGAPVRSVAAPSVGGGVTRRRSRAVFSDLVDLIAQDAFHPVISSIFPFREAAEAVATVETGHATGKTAVLLP
jgi:NADPH:quinone reductase-like Zn-dependent oxidoreductase